MAKINDLIGSKLQNVLKKEEKENFSIEDMLILTKNDDFYNNLEEQNLSDYLKKQSLELFKLRSQGLISIGKILFEVFEELGRRGSPEGFYGEWLKINEINQRTALRYRKRYELYLEVNETAKNIVSVLPQNYIEFILLQENKDKYIKSLNSCKNIKEIIETIKSEVLIEKKLEDKEEIISIIDYSFKEYKDIFKNIDEKSELLKENEKLEIKKHLDKINKILNKI